RGSDVRARPRPRRYRCAYGRRAPAIGVAVSPSRRCPHSETCSTSTRGRRCRSRCCTAPAAASSSSRRARDRWSRGRGASRAAPRTTQRALTENARTAHVPRVAPARPRAACDRVPEGHARGRVDASERAHRTVMPEAARAAERELLARLLEDDRVRAVLLREHLVEAAHLLLADDRDGVGGEERG